MILTVYHARWWSSIDWQWNEADLLAESEEQVRAYVDTQTAPQYRERTLGVAKDTLTIWVSRTEQLPIRL